MMSPLSRGGGSEQPAVPTGMESSQKKTQLRYFSDNNYIFTLNIKPWASVYRFTQHLDIFTFSKLSF